MLDSITYADHFAVGNGDVRIPEIGQSTAGDWDAAEED